MNKINLIKDMNFEFDKSKLASNIRLKYDFSKDYSKPSLTVTDIKGSITDSVELVIKRMNTVNEFIDLCTVSNGNDDIWGYDTAMNLFFSDYDYNYWIRLLAVENENNVWIKTYNK